MTAINTKWKYEKLVAVVCVSQTTQNLAQVPDFTSAIVPLIHDTICFVAFSLPLLAWFALKNNFSIMFENMS